MAVDLVRLSSLVGACGWPERTVGNVVVLPAVVALVAAGVAVLVGAVECEKAAAGSVVAAEAPRVSKLTMPRCAADVMAATASRCSRVW